MQAYATLYPYAVICMAITASLATMIGGLYAFIMLIAAGKASLLTAARTKEQSQILPDPLGPAALMPYVIGGTAIFVAACLCAMLELKIGAWVASIGCS